MITPITTGKQSVTATGAITGSADISGMTGDATIKVRVLGLTAGKKARIVIEDSVNAFTNALPVTVIDLFGETTAPQERHYSFRKYQLPSARFGTASAVLRLNVISIDGATTLVADAWIEN